MDGKIDYDDFIPKYLASFGVKGGMDDFIEIRYWKQRINSIGFGMVPSCLDVFHIVYGDTPNTNLGIQRLMDEILNYDNWNKAIIEYRKQNEKSN